MPQTFESLAREIDVNQAQWQQAKRAILARLDKLERRLAALEVEPTTTQHAPVIAPAPSPQPVEAAAPAPTKAAERSFRRPS